MAKPATTEADPYGIAQAQTALEAALARRDQDIVRMVDEGTPAGEVAVIVGVARTNVQRILARHRDTQWGPPPPPITKAERWRDARDEWHLIRHAEYLLEEDATMGGREEIRAWRNDPDAAGPRAEHRADWKQFLKDYAGE